MREIESLKKRYYSLTQIPMAYRILIVDTETSGLPKSRNQPPSNVNVWPHIVQLSAILYKCPYAERPGRTLKTMNRIIRPTDWTISPESTAIHTITNEHAKREGIPIADAVEELTNLANQCDAICCHNVAFDIPVILAEMYRSRLIAQSPAESIIGRLPTICTMEIGKKLCRILVEGTRNNGTYLYYKSPKLGELYEYVFHTPFKGTFHDALNDCKATRDILDMLVQKHVPFLRVAAPELFKPILP
jgi:DNA polymerase III epsilon subunit-like protein